MSRVVRSTGGWQLLAAGLSTSRGTLAELVQGAACQGFSNVQGMVVSPAGTWGQVEFKHHDNQKT